MKTTSRNSMHWKRSAFLFATIFAIFFCGFLFLLKTFSLKDCISSKKETSQNLSVSSFSSSTELEETIQIVHTWKSKLIKSDKTLLEIVKEESQNIEVLPCLFFLSQLFHQYDVTFERYFPVYRLKEAAVLASYSEAVECLEQIDGLSGKEKACALFALAVYEARRRPRPDKVPQADLLKPYVPSFLISPPPLPSPKDKYTYFPYRDHNNLFFMWIDSVEPDEAIEPSYWEKWEKVYKESLNDAELAFSKIPSTREFYPMENSKDFVDCEDGLVRAWIRNIERCAKLAEKYVGSSVSYDDFVMTYPVPSGFAVLNFTGMDPNEFHGRNTADEEKFGTRFLKGVEQFQSDSVSEIQTAYALREYWLQLSHWYRPIITGAEPSPKMLCVNASYDDKTVGGVARELAYLRRQSYNPYSVESGEVSKEQIRAWRGKLVKSEKSLTDIVKEEAKNIETLPVAFFRPNNERYYDLTFERYLPFYRLKEAAVLAESEEAAQCLEQYESFSGKEKACALTALVIFEKIRRGSGSGNNRGKGRLDIWNCLPFFPYYPTAKRSSVDLLICEKEPDESISDDFWKRWDALYQREASNKEIALTAISSKRQFYSLELDESEIHNDELVKRWRKSAANCAALAEKYVGKQVTMQEFLYDFDPWTMDAAKRSELLRCFAPYGGYNPNAFGSQFLQGLDSYRTDEVDEIQTTYALREYWLLLNRGKNLQDPEFLGINSSYSDKTVADVVRELDYIKQGIDAYTRQEWDRNPPVETHRAYRLGVGNPRDFLLND